MKSIEIDRSKRLKEETHKGHNRWHPAITPVLEAEPGEEVVLETRDASDCQIRYGSAPEELVNMESGAVHPLTGPVYVKGAMPGDLLEVEYLDILPQRTAYTRFTPNRGFLKDLFLDSFVAHWDLVDGWATSPQIPGVHILGGPFMGTAGLAPSPAQVEQWNRREAELVDRGGDAFLPSVDGAVPNRGPAAEQGLRTMPPRENCGNVDIKQLTRRSKLFIPVAVEGALYSAGDGHFAQGDCEACINAIEMGATVAVRFRIHEGEARRLNIRFPRFSHSDYFIDPAWAAPQRFIATMGMPIRDDGTNENGDLNLAARNALIQMIDLIQERGFTRQQAYIICSVAADLKISNLVDAPNFTVSAFLPEDVFQG